MGLDPVCKMEVNPASAEGQSEHEGQSFYFCSKECKQAYLHRLWGRKPKYPPKKRT